MQNFSEIGEVPWPRPFNITRILQRMTLKVGGDFNFPSSKTDKERGSDVSSRKDVASEMEQLTCIKLDLDDAWRTLHPDGKHFTLRTSDLKNKIQITAKSKEWPKSMKCL